MLSPLPLESTMPPQGLASTVQIEKGEWGTNLVDSWNRRTLTLTDTEARLLEMWDGSTDAAQVAKQAQAAGIPIDGGQVTVFLLRLASGGATRVDGAGH
jgi:hypothetical protein